MNSMDEQLWAYIDGTCTAQEREAIEQLVATDGNWREKHRELLQFNSELTAMELDEPPMAFTYNVLEGIRTDYARKPLKAAVNATVVKLLGGFFVVSLLAMFIFILTNINWSGSGNSTGIDLSNKIPDLSTLFTGPVFKCFMFADVVLGLFLFNEYLRRRGTSKQA